MTPPTPAPPELSCEDCPSRFGSLFSVLNREQVRALDRAKSACLYRKGQVLFYEGQPAAGVSCVVSGKVKIVKAGSRGHEQIVSIAKAGDLIGYRALFAGKPNQETAEVLEESLICTIEKDAFLGLVTGSRPLSLRIIKTLCLEVDAAEDRLLDQIDKPVQVRMARLLLMLKEMGGKRAADGSWELGVSLSRRELAEMIGTTQETAIRLLSRLKKLGVIDVQKRCIRVKRSDTLLKTARLGV